MEIFFHSIYRRELYATQEVSNPPSDLCRFLFLRIYTPINQMGDTEVQRQMVKGKQSYGNYVKTYYLCSPLSKSNQRHPCRFQHGTCSSACQSAPSRQGVTRELTCQSLLCTAFQIQHLLGNPSKKHTMQISFKKEIEHAKN